MNGFNKVLMECLKDVKDGEVRRACEYALHNGGKRIRPALLFGVLKSYGLDQQLGINAAIGIELIHTYSLIHDDLPAMDDAKLRRGKPCVHHQYGEDMAILAGDTLLTEAFGFANHAVTNTVLNQMIVDEFVKASGGNGMIHGQELDILNIDDDTIEIDLLDTINIYKTSKLLTLPLKVAAIIANRVDDLPIWESIGTKMGLLFQIQDDLLDLLSDTTNLGKDINQDSNKITYPKLIGEACAREKIMNLYNECMRELDQLHIDKEPLINIFDAILKREK